MDEVEELISGLKDADPTARVVAAMRLSRMGVRAVPGLIDALKDADVRESAALVLGKIGDASAFPALLYALEDKDADVRESAARALEKIAEKNPGDAEVLKAVPALIDALKGKEGVVQENMARALGKIAKGNPGTGEALKAVSALVDALTYKEV